MKKVSFHNKTDKPVHLGPVMVMPGQTREVPEQYAVHRVQTAVRTVEELQAESFDVTAFARQNQATEIAALPELSDADFKAVVDYYATHQAPKKLAAALRTEMEARAAEAAAAKYVDSLAMMSDEELNAEADAVADDNGRLALVQAEQETRG